MRIIRFVLSYCPCLFARKNSDSIGRIFLKFDFWVFLQNLPRKNSSFTKIWQEYLILYIPHICILWYSTKLFLEWELLDSYCLTVRVCSQGIARVPLEGFSWNLIFEYFSKIQVSLKYDKYIWYFTFHTSVYYDIPLNSS